MSVKMKQWFLRRQMQKKLVLSVYTTIIVVFLALDIFLIIFANQDARNEQLSNAAHLVSYGNLLIEKEQSYLYGIAAHYAITSEVQTSMNMSNRGLAAEELSNELISVSQSRMYVLGLTFYNLNGKAINHMSIDASYGALNQDPNDETRPFYKLISGRINYIWEYIPKGSPLYLEQDNSPKLCLWYVVKHNSTFRPIGVINISLDTRKLLSTQIIPQGLYDTVMVVNQDGKMVFGKGEVYNSFTDQTRLQIVEATPKYRNTGYFPVTLGKTTFYVVFGKVRDTGIITYALIPDKLYWGNIRMFWQYSILGIILCLLSILPLLILTTNLITKPINKLADYMRRFSNGERNIHFDFGKNDEIGKLGEIFSKMVRENQNLIEKTLLLTIRRQAAELALSQAQINPHFIYNMLNTMQWTALADGNDDIAEMANQMGIIFRFTLNKGYDFITVEQEYELLECYFELQKRRFKDRLTWSINVDKSAYDAYIPKLLIQPLAENSIIHGVADSKDTVHIDVCIEKDGDHLNIKIFDNGIGIPPNVLAMLPDKLSGESGKKPTSQFAMRNISDRLKLYFNERHYVFSIESNQGEGVRITIVLPYLIEAPALIAAPERIDNIENNN